MKTLAEYDIRAMERRARVERALYMGGMIRRLFHYVRTAMTERRSRATSSSACTISARAPAPCSTAN